MLNNEVVRNLLSINKDAFRIMHCLYDFDFEKDFSIAEQSGRFTHNSIKKLIGGEVSGFNVAIIIAGVPHQLENTYFVKMTRSGFVIESGRLAYRFRNYSHFWVIGRFEEARKEENKTYFVIWQPNESKAPYIEKKPDFSGRFSFNYSIGWGDGHGRRGVSQIIVNDTERTGERITYKCMDPGYSENVHDFLDKSGYFMEGHRQDLQRRAQALRKQRAAAKVAEMDFSKEVAAIEKAFSGAKQAIQATLATAESREDYNTAERMARALSWAFPGVERFKKTATEKGFSSPADAASSFDRIMSEVKKITL